MTREEDKKKKSMAGSSIKTKQMKIHKGAEPQQQRCGLRTKNDKNASQLGEPNLTSGPHVLFKTTRISTTEPVQCNGSHSKKQMESAHRTSVLLHAVK
jgi:hypothetical protein